MSAFYSITIQPRRKASLLADKLYALLQRSYVKGRDLYDLFWYLSDPAWSLPNLTLLNNALQQTGWEGESLHPENWRDVVRRRVAGLQWERVIADVRPFLERDSQATLLTRENLMRVLQDSPPPR